MARVHDNNGIPCRCTGCTRKKKVRAICQSEVKNRSATAVAKLLHIAGRKGSTNLQHRVKGRWPAKEERKNRQKITIKLKQLRRKKKWNVLTLDEQEIHEHVEVAHSTQQCLQHRKIPRKVQQLFFLLCHVQDVLTTAKKVTCNFFYHV